MLLVREFALLATMTLVVVFKSIQSTVFLSLVWM